MKTTIIHRLPEQAGESSAVKFKWFASILLLISLPLNATAVEFKQPMPSTLSWPVIIFCMIAIFAILVLWLKLKKNPSLGDKKLKVIEQRKLNAKTHCYVMNYKNKEFLLIDNGQQLVVKEGSENEL